METVLQLYYYTTKKIPATLRGSRPGGSIRIARYDDIDDVIISDYY